MTPTVPRRPVVAGAFYPADADALRRAVEEAFAGPRGPGRSPSGPRGPRRTRALVVPHAGYVYSGPIAARAYDRIAREVPPPEVLLLGVDHHGNGPGAALSGRAWRTPLGTVDPPLDLLGALEREGLEVDEDAHAEEHSLEVQLPFLQTVLPGVPVAMLQVRFAPFAALRRVAARVAAAVRDRPTLLIASTDFSHYVPAEVARRLDGHALDAIQRRDGAALYRVVTEEAISMCGIAPTTVLLEALHDEPLRVENLGWGHSGEAEPMTEVVGYAALALTSSDPG